MEQAAEAEWSEVLRGFECQAKEFHLIPQGCPRKKCCCRSRLGNSASSQEEQRICELCPLVQSQRVIGLMFTFSRADLPNLRSLQSCFFTLWPDLVRGGQEPQPRAPLGERAGSCVAPLLKVDSWPRKVMALSNSERSGDEAASVGLRRHIQALAALERILETLYQILFCFLHRPLKETAATASKGTLSHHSPPMSCQEPVMAQVHPQHPSPSLGQSPSFPTCRQLSWGRLQAKAQGGQAANNLHTLVPYLVITTVQMPVEAHHLPCK